MSDLFRKYGQSLLGETVGLENSAVRQKKDNEIHGKFQNDARQRRVARRGYRDAMRRGNMQGAMDSLDWLEKKGNSLGSGIGLAGVRMNVAANPAGAMPQAPQDPNAFANKNPQAQNLDLRLGLFNQMKDTLAKGGNLKDYWGSAKGLGVSPAGFGSAMERAKKETLGDTSDPYARIPNAPNAGRADLTTPGSTSSAPLMFGTRPTVASNPSPNDSSLGNRLQVQGQAKSLWDRNLMIA